MGAFSNALQQTNNANIWATSSNITYIVLGVGAICGILLFFFWIKPVFIDSNKEENRFNRNF